MLDPTSLWKYRIVERMLVATGGVAAIILGFMLFVIAVPLANVEVNFWGFIVNGQGPGIAFMAAGIWLLYRCLRTPLHAEIKLDDKGRVTEFELLSRQVPPPENLDKQESDQDATHGSSNRRDEPNVGVDR